jgi:hypothetical protein
MHNIKQRILVQADKTLVSDTGTSITLAVRTSLQQRAAGDIRKSLRQQHTHVRGATKGTPLVGLLGSAKETHTSTRECLEVNKQLTVNNLQQCLAGA